MKERAKRYNKGKEIWNWIENIIYWWIKKIQKMKFSKNKSVKECRFYYSVSDIRKANDDIINGKTATTKGRNSVIKKKYSASEMNGAWLKIKTIK